MSAMPISNALMLAAADDAHEPEAEAGPIDAGGALLLNPQAAADALAISVDELMKLTKEGQLTCVRIGRSVRFDPRDILGNGGPLMRAPVFWAVRTISAVV